MQRVTAGYAVGEKHVTSSNGLDTLQPTTEEHEGLDSSHKFPSRLRHGLLNQKIVTAVSRKRACHCEPTVAPFGQFISQFCTRTPARSPGTAIHYVAGELVQDSQLYVVGKSLYPTGPVGVPG